MHNQDLPQSRLLAYDAAQAYLGGVSRSTIKTLVGRGELRPISIGRRTLFPRAALDAYIARQSDASE